MAEHTEARRHVAIARERATAGDLDGAVVSFREAIAVDPGWGVPYNALGVAFSRAGRLAEAAAAFQAAIDASPRWPDAWTNLARTRLKLGDRAGALDAWSLAVARGAADDALRVEYSRALRSDRRLSEAAKVLQAVAEPPPEDALWLGTHLASSERFAAAIPVLRRAVALLPDTAEAPYALGVALQKTFDLSGAEAAFKAAIALRPDYAEAWNNLGNALKAQVRFTEAIEAYRGSLRAQPDKGNTHRNLLFALQYDPDRDAAAVFEAHRAYGARFADPMPPTDVDRDPDRRLRIGFVSADFGNHPVGYFLAPFLAHRDKQAFELFAYAAPRPEDELTRRIRAGVDRWIPTDNLDDDALAARIRADRIDILVDLGGHTRGSRVQVFAKKPAPVQATWAGYVGTTGLPTIDWVIGDDRHTPQGTLAVEQIWRLPRSYVCWEPPDTPEPRPLPMLTTGTPLLACFNNLPKLNRRVIALWSRILVARPDARLLLVTKSLGDRVLQDRYRAWFAEDGVDPSRIEMSGRMPREQILALYGTRVDLGLDPFPYSGGLTTLEALWMGVPVVTLGGDRFASRHSLGHMGAMGLTGFTATDPDDYLRIALRWLDDPAALAEVRASLRPKMLASPLCDGEAFARDLEAAFRGMWRAFTA